MTWESLPDRFLDKRELRDLVEDLENRPELWSHHVEFGGSGEARHYASLHRDSFVDIWVICWRPEDDTGWHDHDVSSGALRVVAGTLKESNPRIGGEHLETLVSQGQSVAFGPEHIHRINGHAEASVSIHAYSPPLWRLGQYSISDNGVMRRTSVSYADELRQVDALV